MSSEHHRILFVQKSSGGGTATALCELLRYLDRDRFEPVVLFYGPDQYVSQIEALGIPTLVLSSGQVSLADVVLQKDATAHLSQYGKFVPLVYRVLHALWLVFKVAFLIRKERIDLVHHNDNLYQDRFTVAAASLAGVPQVCHMHSFSSLSNFEKLVGKSVKTFLSVSSAVEQYYLDQGIPKAKSHIVYNGFDIPRFEQVSQHERSQIRQEFQIAEFAPLLVNLGRFDAWKGQDYFLQAFAQVVSRHSAAKALLVGELTDNRPWNRAYYEKLKTLVEQLNLQNHVVFTGYRTDIPQILSAADILVHSASLPEPFGRVIVEGILAERPVIATAAGGVLDIIEDHKTGILVPPQDADRMAEAILWVLQNPESAAAIAKTGKQSAIAKFAIEKQVETVQQIYEDILG